MCTLYFICDILVCLEPLNQVSVRLITSVFFPTTYSLGFCGLNYYFSHYPPSVSLCLPGWCLQVSVGVWLTHRLNNSLGPNEISLALMKPLMRLHGFRPLPHTHTDSLTLPHTLNLTSKHAFVLSGTEQACKSTRLHEWTVQTLALHGSNVTLKQVQKNWHVLL